jgi:predicted dehydrogenase
MTARAGRPHRLRPAGADARRLQLPRGLPRRRLEVLGTTGQILAERTMGQTPGGVVRRVCGRLGLDVPVHVPDAGASPFARQMAAFGRWLSEGGDAFDLDRDLHLMHLLDRAYRSAEAC